MLVLKFGATSVSHPDGVANAIQIVAERLARKPTIIISALAGVTRDLFRATEAAVSNDRIVFSQLINGIRQQHAELAERSLERLPSVANSYRDLLADEVSTVRSMLESVAVLREATPRARDAIAAIGLRLSARLFADTLRAHGMRAELVRAEDIIRMRERFWFNTPDINSTRRQARRLLFPLFEKEILPVMAGCIGAEKTDGHVLLLGKNGADRSATIIGAAIGADEVQLWGDVDGIYTCDPDVVPNARIVHSLTFSEAAELGHFGATHHRSTFGPVSAIKLPVRVVNTYNPASAGTLITSADSRSVAGPRAICCTKATTIVHMTASTPLTVPQLADLFKTLMDLYVPLEIVALSDASLTVTLPDDTRAPESAGTLQRIGEEATLAVEVFRNFRILSVIGEGLAADAAARARVVHAMDGIAAKMALPGRSGATISVVVDEGHARALARKIHRALFEPEMNWPAAAALTRPDR